jgi:hypothetical protein
MDVWSADGGAQTVERLATMIRAMVLPDFTPSQHKLKTIRNAAPTCRRTGRLRARESLEAFNFLRVAIRSSDDVRATVACDLLHRSLDLVIRYEAAIPRDGRMAVSSLVLCQDSFRG